MRDKRRRKRILLKLEKLWLLNHDSRFGQLLCGWLYKEDKIPFYEEDYVFEKRLDQSIEKAWKSLKEQKLNKMKKAYMPVLKVSVLKDINRLFAKAGKAEERKWKREEGQKR